MNWWGEFIIGVLIVCVFATIIAVIIVELGSSY